MKEWKFRIKIKLFLLFLFSPKVSWPQSVRQVDVSFVKFIIDILDASFVHTVKQASSVVKEKFAPAMTSSIFRGVFIREIFFFLSLFLYYVLGIDHLYTKVAGFSPYWVS